MTRREMIAAWPLLPSALRLAMEPKKQGYSVFCVDGGPWQELKPKMFPVLDSNGRSRKR